MYHVSAQGVDERMINVHDYYYLGVVHILQSVFRSGTRTAHTVFRSGTHTTISV